LFKAFFEGRKIKGKNNIKLNTVYFPKNPSAKLNLSKIIKVLK
jgi:hypothetical protein